MKVAPGARLKGALGRWSLLGLLGLGLLTCRTDERQAFQPLPPADTLSPQPPVAPAPAPAALDYDSSAWTELRRLEPTLTLDLRYATSDNFVGEPMYDCGRCFLRPPAARALAAAQRELQAIGLGFIIYDCYRPRPVQRRLWEKVPDPRFVSPPERGSMHNRGLAVDLGLVDTAGHPLDMGSAYDHFGPEGYATYTDLPDAVLAHRRLLRETLERHGFIGIRTEWWHFSMRGQGFPVADWTWPCPGP